MNVLDALKPNFIECPLHLFTDLFPVSPVAFRFDHEAFWNLLKRSQRLLICLPEQTTLDHAASAMAWKRVLTNLGKEVDCFSASPSLDPAITRQRWADEIRTTMTPLRTYAIEVNIQKTGIQNLSYKHNKQALTVLIEPKTGGWNADDVRLSTSSYRYDLVFCLGVQDRPQMGTLWKEQRDLFFQLPILNLDCALENTAYSAHSFTHHASHSLCELTFQLLEVLAPELLTADVSTDLLLGITQKSQRFHQKHLDVTTLESASKLIQKGARRDEVSARLTRFHSIETVRVWGRLLSRLKGDEEKRVMWTALLQRDLEQSDLKTLLSSEVFEDLLLSSPYSDTCLLFVEEAPGRISLLTHGARTDVLQHVEGVRGNMLGRPAVLTSLPSVHQIDMFVRDLLQKLNAAKE